MENNRYNNISDSQLWFTFLRGDKNAFNIIYEKNVQSLYKYGMNFSKDSNLVKDCIHDVFVNLYKYRENLNETNNIQYYLFKALKHSIIKAISKSRKLSPFDDVEVKFYYENSIEDTVTENDIERDQLLLIQKAITKLSIRQKEALYLKFNLGLKYDEIARVMDVNYQSARNLVHRGIQKVRAYCKSNSVLVLFIYANRVNR
ncbi:sigma-70 family RNA polymerase sigma factor [Prolixibacteraceae bacterium Z1-6]|uniref:Sigma-70 family RNA polymerase sigma factor n=1 Tax=Draconibacterium aestuarii TaxID=2998507 RepID=A0A9X3J503_9BACT|nr:sigma-70 family RNA polymerase sigma factor [Prolixibacteraceae bacterium Z1-6]